MKRVLIVDDHHGVAYAISVVLKWDGRMTPVGPADSVARGLELVEGVDAVVLDLHVQDCEGPETVKRFRAGAGDVPIVVYSATDSKGASEAADGQADRCVAKGEVGELISALESVLKLPVRDR